MKKLILLFALISTQVFADDYRHLVSFGSHGLGWSGAFERMETRKDSAFADVDHLVNNLGINYGYRLSDRFVLGAFFASSKSEHEFNTSRKTSTMQVESTALGLYGLYHFSDTISSAWYAGLSIGSYTYEEETSHDVSLAESKSPFEFDDGGMMYEVVVGKRFRLIRWNIDNLTYAPQIGLFARTHSKDMDDQNIENGFGISFQPVKFDLLF